MFNHRSWQVRIISAPTYHAGEDEVDVFHDMPPGLAECGFGCFFWRTYDGRPDLSFDVPEFSADAGTGAGYDAAKGLLQ